MSFGDRREPLRSNPAKTAAWHRRTRKRLRPRSETPRRRPAEPAGQDKRRREWTQAVFRLHGSTSVILDRRTGRYPKATHAHHGIPKQVIKDSGKLELLYDPENGVPIDHQAHFAHEYGPSSSDRIPRAALPAGVIAWARRHGFGWYLDNPEHYP